MALNDDDQVIHGKVDWWPQFQTATMFKVGQPMGVFAYGYVTGGLFQNEADIVATVPRPEAVLPMPIKSTRTPACG